MYWLFWTCVKSLKKAEELKYLNPEAVVVYLDGTLA